jgi:hypothetical protein
VSTFNDSFLRNSELEPIWIYVYVYILCINIKRDTLILLQYNTTSN